MRGPVAAIAAITLFLSGLVGLVLPAQATTTDEEECRIPESNGVDTKPKFSGGDGSESNPFLISSPGNLKTLSNCSMEWIVLNPPPGTNDPKTRYDQMSPTHNSPDVYYRQTTNIDMTGEDILVLFPNSARRFRANYDGGGFAIHGLSPTLTASTSAAGGLFGYGQDCSVTNLTVSGSLNRTAGPEFLGLVMGHSSGCAFDKVTAHGTVTSSGSGVPDVGGIIGRAVNTTIENSVSHIDLEAIGRHVGGAVGFLDRDSLMTDVDVRRGQIAASSVEHGSVKNTSCTSFYGGAIGFAYGSEVLRVSSSVRVEAEYTGCADNTALRGGGLIGEASLLSGKGSIQNSSSTGDLVVKEVNRLRIVGGLVGQTDMPITSSFSTSKIEVSQLNVSSERLGGLVGEAVGSIHRSYFAGSIDITALDTLTTRGSRTGGLVGRLRAAVTESYANVVITGSAAQPAAFVGELVVTTDASVANSFAFGSIQGAHAPSGLIGQNNTADASKVNNSYTFVELNRGSSTQAWRPVVEFQNVSPSVFWNLESSGIPAETSEQDFRLNGSTLLTSNQFSIAASFASFDFPFIWTMGTCAPYLTWIGSSPTGLCPAQAPTAPTIASITPGDGQLTVAFTAPSSDGGDTVTNYEYSIDQVTYTPLAPESTSSPFVISGLTNGTDYTVTLRAINSVGSSPSSTGVTATPVAPPPPPPPPPPANNPPPPPVAPEPAPTPESLPAVEDEPAATPSPSPTPTVQPAAPAPSPRPTVNLPAPAAPAATPSPEPTPEPSPTSEPTPQPETTTQAEPEPAPAAASAPRSARAAVVASEQILRGAISINGDADQIFMPAIVLEEIAFSIAPPGAPIAQGTMIIESGQARIVIRMIAPGDVGFQVAELGSQLIFTLQIPGFETSSLTVAIEKQTAANALGLFAIFGGLAILTAVALWWLLANRRRLRSRSA